MGKTAVDLVVNLCLLAAALAVVLLWNESRDNGRYQLRVGEVVLSRYQGRLATPAPPEPRLFRIDTRSGRVWALTQTLYEDTGFVTYLGFWSTVDTMYRFIHPDSLRGE
jgi:hypothetical protein